MNPLPPIIDNKIMPHNAQKWIDHHDPSLRPIAKQLVNRTCYRSHKQFMKQLGLTISSFNRFLTSLPKEDREYILIVCDADAKSGTKEKSNFYVSSLALSLLIKMPSGIISDSSRDLAMAQSKYPHSRHLLIIDDAIYSGGQLCGHLKQIRSIFDLSSDYQAHLAIPFMTKYGIQRIKDTAASVTIHDHSILLPLIHQLPEDVLHVLSHDLHVVDDSPVESKTLTYFAHKIPDDVSTITSVLEGNTLYHKVSDYGRKPQLTEFFMKKRFGEERVDQMRHQEPQLFDIESKKIETEITEGGYLTRTRFVPVTLPPYKKIGLSTLKELKHSCSVSETPGSFVPDSTFSGLYRSEQGTFRICLGDRPALQ